MWYAAVAAPAAPSFLTTWCWCPADKTCPAGDDCQNQRFQKRQNAEVKPFQTEWKGWGLKASGEGGITLGSPSRPPLPRHALAFSLTPKGSCAGFVLEYVGEVLDVQTWESRLKEYKAENRPLHCHVLNDHMVIDAGVKGNMARLINHSCEPNCTTIRWVVKGEDRIGIFALRDIAQGEEITIDYSWSPSEVGDQPCYCGAPSCTGYIGEKAFYDSARQGNQVGLARYSQKCHGHRQLGAFCSAASAASSSSCSRLNWLIWWLSMAAEYAVLIWPFM